MARAEQHPAPRRGFTLVEMLVAMSVLILMVGMLAQVLSSAQTGLSYLDNSALRRQDAGTVLASIAKDLRSSPGGTGLVGYVVRWSTTPAGAPQPTLCRLFMNATQAQPQLAQAQSS